MVKQISVFLENKEGRLADATQCLGDHGINIRALSIADTKDFGILRMIVNDPDRACAVLKAADFTVSIKEVLAISVEDKAGALSKALRILQKNGIFIEYMYAFCGKTAGRPLVILKLSDNESAVRVLAESGISVVEADEVYSL